MDVNLRTSCWLMCLGVILLGCGPVGPIRPSKPERTRSYEIVPIAKPKPVPNLDLIDYRCETALGEVGYLSDPLGGSTQTKDGVSITLAPLPTFSVDYLRVAKLTPIEGSIPGGKSTIRGERLESAFPGRASAPVLSVTISNKTDHVISLAGLVVAFTPETGNPITALSTGIMGQSASVQGGNLSQASEERTRLRGSQSASDLSAAIDTFKLPPLTDLVKVLPGYSFTGHVAFDASLLEVGKTGKVVFFELVTEVDRAGNATKRANFSFDFNVYRSPIREAGNGKDADFIKSFFANCESEQAKHEDDAVAARRARQQVIEENIRLNPTAARLADPQTCSDHIDNDSDGWIDVMDPDCRAGFQEKRATGSTQCNDGKDNDSDGLVDSQDPQCLNGVDNDESQ